ncbi:MAG: MarR family winged helix-turn-helix transcriptional regulator [Pseudomonadota bacterium]
MAYNLRKSPGHLLRRAQQYAHDLYSKEVGSKGPTPRQFEVLHTVSQNEGLSQTDLVRATGIDRSTLADMIARMINKGLLSRSRTKEDARANAVSITAAGKRMLQSAMNSVNKAESAALAVLPKTQQAAFMKALGAYADALDKMEDAAPAPRKKRAATKKKKAAPARKKAAAKKKAPAKRKAPAKKKRAVKRRGR